MTVRYFCDIREARSLAVSIFAAVALAMLAASPASIAAAAGCSPYGDPPQTLISDPVPNCIGGTRLGPWEYSHGTAPHACLHQSPPPHTTDTPPLLVLVHLPLAA